MTPGNKVIFNTIILYARVLITSGITLYTTRLILDSLGSVNYGIFTLIGGVILMLSFLNTAMITSTQRYLSVAMGEDNDEKKHDIFANSLILHIFIGLLTFILLEIASFFLFDLLTIPIDRLEAAKIIYQIMIFSVVFTVVVVPFNAMLVSHENMTWVVLTSIINVLLNLILALSLKWVSYDKLIFYSLMVCIINIVVYIMIFVFCLNKYIKYSITNVFRRYNKIIILKLASFGGWSLYGISSTLLRLQIIAVILNVFLGPVVNAAYGIANQITNQLNFFSSSMLWALNPQIMKSEGANDRQRVNRLSLMACKFGYYLLAFIAVPIIFELDGILTFWLKSYPTNTNYFCFFILVSALIGQLTIGLKSAAQAINRVKVYELVTGTILVLNIPLIYILLSLNVDEKYVLSTFVLIQLVIFLIHISLIEKLTGITVREYLRNVIIKVLIPTTILIGVSFLSVEYVNSNYRFIYTLIFSSLFFFISIYLVGLSSDEKSVVLAMIKKLKENLSKKL